VEIFYSRSSHICDRKRKLSSVLSAAAMVPVKFYQYNY